MANVDLQNAKSSKKDEFYTQYHDIENEINGYLEFDENTFKDKIVLLPCDDPEWSNFTKYFAQNFEKLGLKKLISTSYANDSKEHIFEQLTMFEKSSEKFNKDITNSRGKIFTLSRRDNKEYINIDDLDWDYLDGDGDFRSEEVKKLRDEADIIITNPPFSLFREFIAWIFEVKKQFLIIGNINAITYKEVFPLIKDNKIWTGLRFNQRINGKNMTFLVPDTYEMKGTELYRDDEGRKFISVAGTGWYTNIDHGRRHEPLPLMSMEDNLRYNNKLIKKLNSYGFDTYPTYDNYNAIEVPYVDGIPDDFDGVMGVRISFLNKYSPEQFEILGATQRGCHDEVPDTKKYDDFWEVKQNGEKTGSKGGKTNENGNLKMNDGKHNYFLNKDGYTVQSVYQRIFIKHRRKYENRT